MNYTKCPTFFADLNILWDKHNLKATARSIEQAASMGYEAVAVNVEILDYDGILDSGAKGGKKKKSGSVKIAIPPPPDFSTEICTINKNSCSTRKFKMYTRLTLGLADTSQVHNVLKLPAVQQYDILSIFPKSDEMFNTVIKKLEVDLITVDITERASWVSRKNLVQMAVEKGITFEITYAPALVDSSARRDAFTNGWDLLRATKGKGLILTSRATRPIELRAPFDVANMGILFGMIPEQGRRAVSKNALQLLLHSESRRTIKGVMNVQKCNSIVGSSSLANLMKIPEFRAEVTKVVPKIGDEKIVDADDAIVNKKRKL